MLLFLLFSIYISHKPTIIGYTFSILALKLLQYQLISSIALSYQSFRKVNYPFFFWLFHWHKEPVSLICFFFSPFWLDFAILSMFSVAVSFAMIVSQVREFLGNTDSISANYRLVNLIIWLVKKVEINFCTIWSGSTIYVPQSLHYIKEKSYKFEPYKIDD